MDSIAYVPHKPKQQTAEVIFLWKVSYAVRRFGFKRGNARRRNGERCRLISTGTETYGWMYGTYGRPN
jgi:hypothetical protein